MIYEEFALTLMVFLWFAFVFLWYRFARVGIDNVFLYPIYTLFFWGAGQAFALNFWGTGVYIDSMPYIKEQNMLLYGAYSIFTCYLLFSMGILFGINGEKILSNKTTYNINHNDKKIILLTLFVFFSIFLALYSFSKESGIGFFDFIFSSSKHIIISDDGVSKLTPSGYTRTITRLGLPYFLLLLSLRICIVSCNTKVINFCLFFSAISAFLPAFTLSSRGYLMFGMISVCLILFLKRKLNAKRLVIVILSSGILFLVMSILRYSKNMDEGNAISSLGHLFYYGGGNSIFNQSLICKYVFDGGELYWGSIYLGIFVLPIPRAIWAEKPLFSFDQIIAEKIYGLIGPSAYAIPGGIVGESLLNFGFIGSLLMMFGIGYLVIKVYLRILNINKPVLSLIVRGIIFPRFMFTLFGSGIGFALMELVIISIPLLLMYRYILIEYLDNEE